MISKGEHLLHVFVPKCSCTMTPHVLRDAGGLISININGVYFHSAVLLPFGASVKSILGWNQTDDLSEVTTSELGG